MKGTTINYGVANKMQLIIIGKASNSKILSIELNQIQPDETSLMNLLKSYDITIASSCDGAGKCKKCVVNNEILSCQVSASDFYKMYGSEIIISYL